MTTDYDAMIRLALEGDERVAEALAVAAAQARDALAAVLVERLAWRRWEMQYPHDAGIHPVVGALLMVMRRSERCAEPSASALGLICEAMPRELRALLHTVAVHAGPWAVGPWWRIGKGRAAAEERGSEAIVLGDGTPGGSCRISWDAQGAWVSSPGGKHGSLASFVWEQWREERRLGRLDPGAAVGQSILAEAEAALRSLGKLCEQRLAPLEAGLVALGERVSETLDEQERELAIAAQRDVAQRLEQTLEQWVIAQDAIERLAVPA